MLRQLASLAAIILGARLLLGAAEAPPGQPAASDSAAQHLAAGQDIGNGSRRNGGGSAKAVKPQFWFGVAVEKIPPAIARQLKLRPDQGLMVLAILPDSPAAKAGLQADDLLIELNGKPLVSQEDLAVAANNLGDTAVEKGPAKHAAAPVGQPSNFVFLREGDRKSVDITPAQRPEQLLVVGNNAEIFSPQKQNNVGKADGAGKATPNFTNYVAPNGTSYLIGPGYQLDLQSQSAGTVNIRRAVANGERVILSQETDASGKIHNTIRQGMRTYDVEPGRLQDIPENIRGLAAQMLAESGEAGAVPGNSMQEMSRRLNEEQDRIKTLETEVDRLREMVESQQHPAPTQKAAAGH